jgi:hypothetical protein
LIRPEFQAFLENEQQTIELVKDVADVLENIAANPLHTPALYSKFLRALISARLEPTTTNPESKPASRGSATHNGGSPTQEVPQPQFSNSPTLASYNAGVDKGFTLNEFQFDGEMGPVADMSTFPPTMAPTPSEDTMGALTMDNILSNGFWDSMLVPG